MQSLMALAGIPVAFPGWLSDGKSISSRENPILSRVRTKLSRVKIVSSHENEKLTRVKIASSRENRKLSRDKMKLSRVKIIVSREKVTFSTVHGLRLAASGPQKSASGAD
jgi:hypothetical protein